MKQENLESLEKNELESEDFIDVLLDKNSFILELFSGATLPISHPNYYDKRLSIRLIQSDIINDTSVKIEKDTYKINNEKIEKIKSILFKDFSSMISIALRQKNEMFVGGGTSLHIKINAVNISIDYNNISSDDKIFIDSIIEKVLIIIKGQ